MQIKLFFDILENIKANYKTESKFKETIDTILYLHSLVHKSKMSGLQETTYEDDYGMG